MLSILKFIKLCICHNWFNGEIAGAIWCQAVPMKVHPVCNVLNLSLHLANVLTTG